MGKELKYDSLDYYKVLGVSPETPEEELRQKYRDMAKFWHPDHNNSPDAVDMFQKSPLHMMFLKSPKQGWLILSCQ